MIHLVTGYAGYEHIKSSDDGDFNASFFGEGQFIMEAGNQFDASIIDNNTVRVLDGNGMMYGRHFRLERNTYEDVVVSTGTSGMNRCDLICVTYAKDESTGTEQTYLEVIKGAETSGTAAMPAYTNGNILNGAVFNQMPLYKVNISGVVLKELTPLYSVMPTYKALAERYAAEFQDACETHLNSLNVLDTLEEVSANTQSKQLAGAQALKELAATVPTITLDTTNKIAYITTNQG
jgi:hypothetical protein